MMFPGAYSVDAGRLCRCWVGGVTMSVGRGGLQCVWGQCFLTDALSDALSCVETGGIARILNK